MSGPDKAVLVVDDDVELLGMLETLLVGAGYRVITATGGQEALEKVAQEMPALILLDMKMPGMDGWAFARTFWARYGRAAAIVVLTAAENARQHAGELGAEDYLSKPFEIEDLVRIVARYMDTPA